MQRSAATVAVNEKTGTHYIIVTHGLGGNSDGFGEIDKVMLPHLQKLKPQTQFKILHFSYPTGGGTSVFDFAYDDLSDFLHENIPQPTLNDSLVFLAHSQGGSVLSVWKTAAQYGLISDPIKYKKVLNDKIYAQITDQLITIGSPLWGSNQAKLGKFLKLKKGFEVELDGLIFNSDLILWLREIAIRISQMSETEKAQDRTTYTNIAGIFPNDRNKLFYARDQIRGGLIQVPADLANTILKGIVKRYSYSSERFSSGRPGRFESDLSVVIPSTRNSFYYANQKISCENNKIEAEQFQKISLLKPAQYILTEATHTTVLSKRSRGLAYIPFFCVDPEKCTHPTYRYILRLVANCESSQCQDNARKNILDRMFEVNKIDTEYNKILTAGTELQGFALDLNIQVPSDYNLPEKYYTDRPYTEAESVEMDADGNETYVTRRKNTPLTEREMNDKKLAREILKLDSSILGKDLKDTIEVKIVRRREAMSGLTCWGKATECPNINELRLHITGWIKPKSLEVVRKYQTNLIEKYNDGLVLPFTVQLPQTEKYKFKKAALFTKVHPGYSTYVKLDFLDAINCENKISRPVLQK